MMVFFDLISRFVKRHSLLCLSLFILTFPVLSGCWGSPKSELSAVFDFKAIAIDPSTPTTIYVGTDGGGVFKSTDGGSTWTPINSGLTDLKVTALAIDWFTPSRIYAGTENGGIFSSSDYGESWFPPTPISNIRAIVIDRNVCTSTTPSCQWIFVASQESGVWLSQNAGSTYSQFTENPSNQAVTAMAIYPTTLPNPAGRLYIGTDGGGIFVRALHPTVDSKWTEATPGLKVNTQEDVISLAVRPDVISELYVGTSGGGETSSVGSGIYKSTDAGASFDQVYTPHYPFTIYFVVPVVGPNATDLTLYAGSDGIVRSTNYGNVKSWCILWDDGSCKNTTPSTILQPGLTAFAVALNKHTDAQGNVSFLIDSTDTPPRPTLYAALFNRQFIKSTDGGETWTTLSVQ